MDRRTFAKTLAGLGTMPFIVGQASAAGRGDQDMLELMGGSISDVPGIKLGHHTLTKRRPLEPAKPTFLTPSIMFNRYRPFCCLVAVPMA
jgi:hypothetical protein